MVDRDGDLEDDFWLDILGFDDGWMDFPENNNGEDDDLSSEGLFTKWKRQNTGDIDVSITTEGTGAFILRRCKAEFEVISSRVSSLAAADGVPVTISFILNLFVLPLVPILKACMNATIAAGEEPSTKADVIEFMRTLALLSFYRDTPTNFFDKRYDAFYPLARDRSQSIFKQCMSRLKRCMCAFLLLFMITYSLFIG